MSKAKISSLFLVLASAGVAFSWALASEEAVLHPSTLRLGFSYPSEPVHSVQFHAIRVADNQTTTRSLTPAPVRDGADGDPERDRHVFKLCGLSDGLSIRGPAEHAAAIQ